MFITIEGIDGSGKTTQINKVCNFLQNRQILYKKTSEPRCDGEIKWANQLIDIMMQEETEIETQIMLVNAIRAQHIKKIIKPAILQKKIVICDRYIDSTIAYQGYRLEFDIQKIKNIHKIVQENLLPDLTILIDIDPKVTSQRLDLRGRVNQFDHIKIDQMQKIRYGFLKEAELNKDRIHIIDGSRTEEEVFQFIIELFLQKKVI